MTETETTQAEEPDVIDGEAVEGESDPDTPSPSLALAIREERGLSAPPAASLPSEREWKATIAVATEIARTKFVPESYRGQPESVVAAILTGRELGIGPMQSLRDIYMIDGRPVFSASLMLARMRRGGVKLLATEQTAERAYIRAERRDTGEQAEVEWTYEEAEKITRNGKRLVDGDNWRNYRGDMLWARAVGRLARRLGSDLLAGMVYSKEELEDLDRMDEADYSATTAAQPVTWENIDPGKQKHPDTPGSWKDINEALRYVDAGLDWTLVVRDAFEKMYGVGTVAELGDNTQEAGRRLANVAGYLRDQVMGGQEFPPPTDEQIVAAFAWGFEGLAVELPEPDPGMLGKALDEEAAKEAEADSSEYGQQEGTDADEADGQQGFTDPEDIEFGEEGPKDDQ